MFKRLLNVFSSCSLMATLLVTMPSSAVSQTVEVWSNLGLYGGQIYDIAIDPANPDKMFVGSYMGDGLFVTQDGGNSWQPVRAEELVPGEDTFRNHAVWAVKIASSDNHVVWVAHNYWVEKSTDGGQTWDHILNGAMQSNCANCPLWDQFRYCRSLAIHPGDADTLFVGTSGRYSNWRPLGAIYMTEDGGSSWRKMKGPVLDDPDFSWTDPEDPGNFDYEVVDLAVDTNDPDKIVVWAVTSNGGQFVEVAGPDNTVADGTLYRGEIDTATGEDTWTEVFSMEGGQFYDVEVKPNDPNSVFTGNDWGIFRHYKEGDEWKYQWILNLTEEPPEVSARSVRALAFDPNSPSTLYASWKSPLGGMPKLARGAPPYEDTNWQVYSVAYKFLTLAVHPANEKVVFGGEAYLGVYKSENYGETWTDVNDGINAVVVYDVDVDPNDSSRLFAGTLSGLFEKKGAQGWSRLLEAASTSVRFHPRDSQTLYTGLGGQLAWTTDSGVTWSYSDDYFGVYEIWDIAIDPTADPNIIYIAVAGRGDYGKIYKSIDGGTSLSEVLKGENLAGEKYDFNTVVIDPSDHEHILAGGGNFYAPEVLGDLWETTNGGNTWDRTGLQDVIVNALLIDPENPGIMYAGCGYSGGTKVPLYISTDAGDTWEPSFEGLPEIDAGLRGVWTSSDADVFAVGSVGGLANVDTGSVFRYDGSSWIEIDSGATSWLRGVWGSSATNVLAVGDNGTIIRYDGNDENSWSAMNSGTTQDLYGVWGSSATDVFAVGDNGTILHYDGNDTMTWEPMNSGTTEWLGGVWGSSATDVFAVGENGTILHYDGNDTMTWEPMNSGTTEWLNDLWGGSATDVFAVGDNGTILHYDGNDTMTWEPMNSGTTEHLLSVWGSSATNVFAVGYGGAILHYDGSSWTPMNSDFTGHLMDVFGRSAMDVFAVEACGAVLHYDGSSWSISRPPGSLDNAVTDLEFHGDNPTIVYASTWGAGVHVSPDQAGNWLNLGTPEYSVFAISTGSLYAATQAGLLQCTGTGVIAGQVLNAISQAGIHEATVMNDLGGKTISVKGEYMMVSRSGICDVTATADLYVNSTVSNVTVYGGDVSWVNIPMQPDSHVVEVIPHYNAGIHDTTRVPNNTGFAVCIVYPNGIDLSDPASITFTVNDGVNEYQRDLSNPAVRWQKLIPGETDTHVTKLWVVYDRSSEAQIGNYAYDTTINIRVDVEATAQATYCFRTETEQEHINANNNLPNCTNLDATDPALDPQAGYDAGIQITSGDLKGAKIVYNSNEPVVPTFGPMNELPPLDVYGALGVGVPVNLQPTGTVFDTPVKLFIPCPGYVDVSALAIYYHNGVNWVLACDASGVQPGGDRWIVPNSRVNHSGGQPPTIEIRVYHGSGAQAGTNEPTPPPSLSRSGDAANSGGGGGCFIATAAYESDMAEEVEVLKNFRDKVLLETSVGRSFVKFYYKVSPSLADYIGKHESLRRAVRIGLMPFVAVSYSAIHFGPVMTLTMLVVILVVPILLVSFHRRKRRAVMLDAMHYVLDPQAGYDAGIQVTSGDLKGAKIVYNSNEPVVPALDQ